MVLDRQGRRANEHHNPLVPFRAGGRSDSPGPRSPEWAVCLVLNRRARRELVGDGPGVARYLRRDGVDLLGEQGQGAADAGLGGPGEGDGDRFGAKTMIPAVPRMMVSRVIARYSSSSRR